MDKLYQTSLESEWAFLFICLGVFLSHHFPPTVYHSVWTNVNPWKTQLTYFLQREAEGKIHSCIPGQAQLCLDWIQATLDSGTKLQSLIRDFFYFYFKKKQKKTLQASTYWYFSFFVYFWLGWNVANSQSTQTFSHSTHAERWINAQNISLPASWWQAAS